MLECMLYSHVFPMFPFLLFHVYSQFVCLCWWGLDTSIFMEQLQQVHQSSHIHLSSIIITPLQHKYLVHSSRLCQIVPSPMWYTARCHFVALFGNLAFLELVLTLLSPCLRTHPPALQIDLICYHLWDLLPDPALCHHQTTFNKLSLLPSFCLVLCNWVHH